MFLYHFFFKRKYHGGVRYQYETIQPNHIKQIAMYRYSRQDYNWSENAWQINIIGVVAWGAPSRTGLQKSRRCHETGREVVLFSGLVMHSVCSMHSAWVAGWVARGEQAAGQAFLWWGGAPSCFPPLSVIWHGSPHFSCTMTGATTMCVRSQLHCAAPSAPSCPPCQIYPL